MDQRAAQQVLITAGLSGKQLIGSGMEGHVFQLDGHTVAKVWSGAFGDHVRALRRFYEALQRLRLPFQTPKIQDVMEVDRVTISVETMLTGTPLLDLISRNDIDPPTFATDAILHVLAALRATELGPDAPALSMLGIVADTGSSADRLMAVAQQKVARFGDQLRIAVPSFDTLSEAVQSYLRDWSGMGLYAIHGDLCPPNILLNEDRTVSAVLDWGFLSHAGDPVFETAITTCIFDMYGPHHRRTDDLLLRRCVAELGEDRQLLLVYRALYAILTSNAYADDGSDGHFEWCVAMLNRADVRIAVGM
jgi:hypothetical protein